MSDAKLQLLDILYAVSFWGTVFGIPIALYVISRKRPGISFSLAFWAGSPVLVWFLLMQIQRFLGFQIEKEMAHRKGNVMYDGTGAEASVFFLGIPLGLMATAVVALAGWGLSKALARTKMYAVTEDSKDR